MKAYSSAVGAGEFVSEIFGDEAQELRDRIHAAMLERSKLSDCEYIRYEKRGEVKNESALLRQ